MSIKHSDDFVVAVPRLDHGADGTKDRPAPLPPRLAITDQVFDGVADAQTVELVRRRRVAAPLCLCFGEDQIWSAAGSGGETRPLFDTNW